jgi:hypothetical protein
MDKQAISDPVSEPRALCLGHCSRVLAADRATHHDGEFFVMPKVALPCSLWSRIGILILVVLGGAAAGCRPSPEEMIKDAFKQEFRENGRRVAVMYARFMGAPKGPVRGPNDFKGPADEAELRSFMASMPANSLAELGITDPQAAGLFVSERDGKPFRIRYGLTGPLSTTYVIVCEAEGVGGRVKAFKTDGGFMELPASEADAFLKGKYDAAYDPGSAL